MDITITLDSETARKYRRYCNGAPKVKKIAKGERLQRVIQHALADWMESVGEGHLESDNGIDFDGGLLGPYLAARRLMQLGAEDDSQPEPMPKTFSAEDAFRARGMGIRLE